MGWFDPAAPSIEKNEVATQSNNNSELQLQTEAKISNEVEIINTEVELAEEVVQQGNLGPNKLSVFNPCIDEMPIHLMRRPFGEKYVLNMTTLTAHEINPWQFLVTRPYLARVLSPFKYIRADVRCKIMVQSTVQQYGWYGVTSLYGLTGGDITNSLSRLSSPRAVIGDIQQRTAVEYLMPYADPNYFMNIDDLANNPSTSRPGRIFTALHALLSTTEPQPASLRFVVYYNFENIELAGVRQYAEAQCELVAEAQMDTRRAIQGSAMTAIGLVGHYLTTGSYWMGQLNDVASKGQKFMKESTQFTNAMGSITQMGMDITQSMSSGYNQLMSAGKELTQNEGSPLRMTPFGDLATAAYQDNAALLGARKDTVMYSPSMLGIADPFTIDELIRIPGYRASGLITETASVVSITAVPWNEAHQNEDDEDLGYMNYFSRFFRLWRGSIEYSIRFFTSPLIAARVRVTVCWGLLDTNNLGGNVWSHTMSIQGSHDFTFSVPYVYDKPFQKTVPQTEDAPTVLVELLDGFATAGDATPALSWVIFQRAGSDFMFRSLRHPAGEQLVAEAQMAVPYQYTYSQGMTLYFGSPNDSHVLRVWQPQASPKAPVGYNFYISNEVAIVSGSGNVTLEFEWSSDGGFFLAHKEIFSTGDTSVKSFNYDSGTNQFASGYYMDYTIRASGSFSGVHFSVNTTVTCIESHPSDNPRQYYIQGVAPDVHIPVTYGPGTSSTTGAPVVLTGADGAVPITFGALAQCEIGSMFDNVTNVNDAHPARDFEGFRDVYTVQDMLMRYGERPTLLANVTNDIIYPDTQALYATGSMFDIITSLYRYWTGSMRFKVAIDQTNDYTAFSMNSGITSTQGSVTHIGNGTTMLYDNIWNVADIEVPWYGTAIAAEVYKNQGEPLAYDPPFQFSLPSDLQVTKLKKVMVAAGRDFQPFILLPPPLKAELTQIFAI